MALKLRLVKVVFNLRLMLLGIILPVGLLESATRSISSANFVNILFFIIV